MQTLEDYDYPLPQELIAQSGAEPRDSSRLMVIDRDTGRIEHRVFRDITDYLRPGDLLVLNQSKVIPARVFAQNPQGTNIEVLLVKEIPPSPLVKGGNPSQVVVPLVEEGDPSQVVAPLVKGEAPSQIFAPLNKGGDSSQVFAPLNKGGAEGGGINGQLWEAMLKPAKRAKGVLRFSEELSAEVMGTLEDGTRVLRFSDNLWNHLEALGQTPLPPYIHASVDPSRYQTVYAKTPGSVAAPTAGLHFTPELMERIGAMGVEIHYVTLHVGPGTFKPVGESIERHVMHAETFEVTEATARAINRAKAEGRRVVAVGTTVVRTLESAYLPPRSAHLEIPHTATDTVQASSGETQIFIYPPYEYKVVDALITNFHLPKSTLLMLVSALMGHDLMMRAYRTAVEQQYRFYSLGDAMFIR
ncbi:MAG: tRNA preQ1(34) S-adenosylmethionine ribosyltransferase-isomerase QueA [Meiothermus sp.]|nr:tRNA preQ1(34) S-adenosylmethionine ribosyltransferase-isomerase QueA [Meiothermus sp.]